MSKLLVVFGATGQQGGSVVDYVVNDPELSKQYKVRGVTREPSKPAAQALQQKGVEVVKGDIDDPESLKRAVQSAHTVFAMTTTIRDRQSKQKMIDQGKTIADEAVAAGAQYFIWSTAPHAGKISGGKLQHVSHFDAKADVEEYIRNLQIKSAFYAPSSFMQNFHGMHAPRPVGDGTYTISNILKPDTQLPLIDVAGDTGKFIGAILAEPDKYAGKVFSAAVKFYSLDEIVQTLSKATSKTVKYKELPEDVFRRFMPPQFADELVEMMQFVRDYGYYGPQQKELVEWTAQQARSKLTTLEDYFDKNSIVLL